MYIGARRSRSTSVMRVARRTKILFFYVSRRDNKGCVERKHRMKDTNNNCRVCLFIVNIIIARKKNADDNFFM